jgi:hypothetical protein
MPLSNTAVESGSSVASFSRRLSLVRKRTPETDVVGVAAMKSIADKNKLDDI